MISRRQGHLPISDRGPAATISRGQGTHGHAPSRAAIISSELDLTRGKFIRVLPGRNYKSPIRNDKPGSWLS